MFKRTLRGIGHGLANWPTRGQPPGQSHILQSLGFRDLWAGLARLAKDFAKDALSGNGTWAGDCRIRALPWTVLAWAVPCDDHEFVTYKNRRSNSSR